MEVPLGVWVSGILTLFIFVVTNLCVSIWWASRLNTIVETLSSELKDIAIELKSSRALFATKEDLIREVTIAERERKAIWLRIDKLHEGKL